MNRLAAVCLACLLCCACAAQGDEPAPPLAAPTPAIPENLSLDESGVPTLDVYVIAEGTVSPMDVESYVEGVVAGEMKNDWPLEALKAQAILARTFVLRFVSEKESAYDGADISTDISEAQAYNASAVNERVREAVTETAGEVLCTEGGALPYAWFHAHSGGVTALAREGLGWSKAEPAYTKSVEGLDSSAAPADAQRWEADFSASEFLAACRQTGVGPQKLRGLSIKAKGESGRVLSFLVDGETVDATRLRMALGSTVMRSTLLTVLDSDGKTVHMEGRGYGHGVGMPQWGAYALAEDGYTGEDIAVYYFEGLRVVRLWGGK